MHERVLAEVTTIVILGIFGQWLAWRVRFPAIVILLALGTVVGPILGMLNPDATFGELLRPFVSLAVSLILFEGGLNLRLRELRGVGGVLVSLMTIGLGVTWTLLAVSGRYVLGLSWPAAALLACILTVTGPTVIGPILRHLRLRGRVASLLKWEGILIDPIGAIMAVLVFAALEQQSLNAGVWQILQRLLQTVGAGVGVGILFGTMMVVAFNRYWVPDFLINPVALMCTLAAFMAANLLQQEAGLLAVTIMGIVVGNQDRTPIRRLIEFKESLTVLLIAILFIVLSARIRWEDLHGLGWHSLLFLALVLILVRPIAIFLATIGRTLNWSERLFLAAMAPRGVVAMAVASVAAMGLAAAQYQEASRIVSVTLLVVFGTSTVYGLLASPMAQLLGLVQTRPQGFLFIGASPWVRQLAMVISQEGYPVTLVDSNRRNVLAAKLQGLRAVHGNALAQVTRDGLDYSGLGRMLAVTSNNEVNSLACIIYAEDFGRQEVYQLSLGPDRPPDRGEVSLEHRGRILFAHDLTYQKISELIAQGAQFKKTTITKEFDFVKYRDMYGPRARPLFVLRSGIVTVVTADSPLSDVKAGDTILALVSPMAGAQAMNA